MDIKDIKVAHLTNLLDVDACLRETRLAVATIEGQIETAHQGGLIPIEQMSPKKQGWLMGAKSALRHAQRIHEDLLDRREAILLAAHSSLKELLVVLENPPISISSAQAEKFGRDIKGIIPKLENMHEQE